MQMAVFAQYAKYYDLYYRDKNYKEESDYVDHLIRRFHPKAKTIIDMGCGTGQHDFHLVDKGYSVTGVDFSDEMLALATKKMSELGMTEKDLVFHLGDIRDFRLNKKFDVVISLFHVMSYQITNEDLYKAFATAAYHLKQGGLFIFDCWYGPGVLSDSPVARVKRTENNNLSVTRIAEPFINLHENYVDVNYQILVADKKTLKMEEINERHRMRYFFTPELKMFFKMTDLELIKLFAFLKETLPDPKEWSACFIAKKLKGKSDYINPEN